jgi:hypothetical protein
LYWLLPLVFVIHDTEELVTMPAWFVNHRSALESLGESGALGARIAASAPYTTARAAVAIGFVLLVLLIATVGVTRAGGCGPWLYVYSSLLGLLFLHVFTHAAQALLFRSYVPGLYGALFAVLPGSAFIYRRLLAASLLSWRTALVSALVGFALFIPGALAAWAVARMLTG